MKPIILFEGRYLASDFDKLKQKYPVWKVVDIYESQLSELFEITYPSLKTTSEYYQAKKKFVDKMKIAGGNWIYYPHIGYLVHAVSENDYYALRTNRNRNLITLDEQKILRDFTVGVVGLSVGGNIAVALTYQGIANEMKLSEFDSLETTNLNRIQAALYDIGSFKIDFIADQIYDVNPYANLTLYRQGLNKATLHDFIYTNPKPKLIFEIIDDFEMKVYLRIEARKAGVPVVTLANLGDSILIDIERYDENRKLPLFHGILGGLPEKFIKNPNDDPNKYAVALVGKEHVPPRAMASIKKIYKTLAGRPQLSNTVAINAGLSTFIARQIALKNKMPSMRKQFVFNTVFL